MKIFDYLKIGFKATLVMGISSLVVLIPGYMFLLPTLGFSGIVSFQSITDLSKLMTISQVILLPIIFIAQGFALIKWRNWIFK